MTDDTNTPEPRVAASVLGPLHLEVDGASTDLGGPKPRLLLALLIASPDRSLTVETLIDGLWGDDPPATARKSTQVHVSNLRRALGEHAPVKTTPGGYVFQTAGVDLDVATFEAEVDEAAALRRTDPARAVEVLTIALGRWHGPAYGDLATEPALQPEIGRLTELRLRANEMRIDARLRLGQHHDVLGELETLIADHPYREQLRAQHMLALYRSGRQVEALRSFERARTTLAEDLGIEPSAMLRELEQQILEQSPDIDSSVGGEGLQTLAFFVTDIVDSTPKWEREPEAMAAGLEQHDEILERAVSQAGGRIFKHTGDGILAVFPTLGDATTAAVTSMAEMDSAAWPTTDPIRIRSAVDSGPVQERSGDYFGQVLNRVMRIQSSAHGGQLLVHDPVASATGHPTRPLGEADYKGIGRLPVSQVTTGVLDADFPPLRTDRAPASMQRPGFSQAIRGYELREQLGAGDFGIVYRAYQASVGREVAVKVIRPEHANDPSFVKRFEAEAQFVAQLEHPHIVSLYDYWRDPEGAYLVMNHLRGGSVAQALERATFNPPAALRVLDQVGGALAYAHRHGVIHGDIKPGNVLMDDDGNAYLSDFGIAHHHVDSVGAPGMSSVAYVAPEEMAGSGRDAKSDIYCLALLAHELLTGRRPALGAQPQPLTELRQDVRAEVSQVIAKATSIDPAQRHDRVEDFLRSLRQAFGTDVLTSDLDGADSEIRNPYKGLRAFGEVDAKDFHGREALVDELLESIRANGLTAAVGPSGSGKSSAVKAGVLPAVRSGALGGATDWVVAEMFPGSYPFEELEATLMRVAVERPDGLLADLQHDDRGLLRVSKQILPDDGTSLLLVIDQFEELFSVVSDAAVRDRFLDNLVTACRDERSRVRVLLTMRADFFDRPLIHADFGELMKRGLVPVASPSDENLALAIARPARDVGLEFEVGLIPAIVQDVAGQPGGLPLLQYVLTELVDNRKGRLLTIADYHETGGVLGALGRRAEEIYAGLNGRGQRAARDLFLRLVSVGEDGDDTRRRIRRSELAAVSSEAGALDGVIEQFGSFRLLSFDHDPVTRGPTVEVAHEALITKWPRFEGWVDDHRDDLLQERRVQDAAREWHEHGRDESYLLRGGRLEQFRAWSESTRVLPGPLVDDYIEASRLAHDEDEREAAQQAERDQRLRRRSRLLVGTGIGVVILLVLAALAIVSRNDANDERARAEELAAEADTQRQLAETSAAEADQQRSRAEGLADELAATDRARALATAATGQLEDDPRLAVTLALESARATAPFGVIETETLDAIHFSLQAARVTFPADDDTPVGVRPAATGLRGIFLLPIDTLFALADEHGRPLTGADCEAYFADIPCPGATTEPPTGLEVRGGMDGYLAFTNPDQPLAGTDIRVSFSFSDADAALMEADAQRGLVEAGIEISVRGIQGLLAREDEFGAFDMWVTAQPAAIRAAALDAQIIDVGAFLGGEALEERFGPGLAAIGRLEDSAAGDPVYAVPYNLDNKSVLWYSKPLFEAGDYQVPTTFEAAVELSDQMVADGIAPWCWSNDTTTGGGGFAATDWVENVVLRQAGPEVYTDWASGDVTFASAPITRAFETLGRLVFPEGYRIGGASAIPNSNFWASWIDLASDSPSCAMHVGPHWVLDAVGATDQQRNNAGVTSFPAIDARYQDLIVGGGNQMALTIDSPEARAALAYLTSHDFYRDRLAAAPSFIPPDPTFDAADLVSESHAEILRITYESLDVGGFYFDASDLMPSVVGGNAFFVEPTRWFVEGPDALDTMLRSLDEAWPRVDEDGVLAVPKVEFGGGAYEVQDTRYRIDMGDVSLVADLTTGVWVIASAPTQVWMADSEELNELVTITRPNGLKTLAEASDPSPDVASIDPRDVDRWLAELPIVAEEDSTLEIDGATVRRLRLVSEPSDFNGGDCAPEEVPCFHVHGLPADAPFRRILPTANGYERVVWIVDTGGGDPIWIWAAQKSDGPFLERFAERLDDSLRVEIDADA